MKNKHLFVVLWHVDRTPQIGDQGWIKGHESFTMGGLINQGKEIGADAPHVSARHTP